MEQGSLTPRSAPDLLKKYGIRPSKKLGQNFLVDEQILKRIVAEAGLTPLDTVLEIGPGLGHLTRQLAQTVGRVIAVEVDKTLIPALEEVLTGVPNVQIVQGDALSLSPSALGLELHYLIVANIPYYITSALVRHYLESDIPPQRLILMVQKEVAERICAEPGKMSVLALSVQYYGRPEILFQVPASAFHPVPEVDSAVLHIELGNSIAFSQDTTKMFFRLIKAGFSQKRKMLRNTLASGLRMSKPEIESRLTKTGIDPQARAESLSLDDWLVLCSIFQP